MIKASLLGFLLLMTSVAWANAIPTSRSTSYCTQKGYDQRVSGYDLMPALVLPSSFASYLFTIHDDGFKGDSHSGKRAWMNVGAGAVGIFDLVALGVDGWKPCRVGESAGEEKANSLEDLSDREAYEYRKGRRTMYEILLLSNVALYGIQFAAVDTTKARTGIALSAAVPILYSAFRFLTYRDSPPPSTIGFRVEPTVLRLTRHTLDSSIYLPGVIAGFRF